MCTHWHLQYEYYILLPPDSKVHGANMGPIWGQQDPGGPHVGPHELCYLGLLSKHSADLLK